MCRIIGVFNTERSIEQVLKGLEVLKRREDVEFWIGADNGEYYAAELQTLRQKVTQESNNCIACCSCKPIRSSKSSGCRFVADAELYNTDELTEKYHVEGESSSEVLSGLLERFLFVHEPDPKGDCSCFNEMDGVYAWAYWLRGDPKGDALCIARDILGFRPVWFAHAEGFAFASEKKALEAMGFPHAIELDPRILLKYHIEEDRLRFVRRDCFSIMPELTDARGELKAEVLTLLRASIRRRIPRDEKFGVLFSGGVDSTLIAYLCKELDADFICYTVAVDEPEMKEAEDLGYAERIAADLGLPLKIKRGALRRVRAA
jgi:diphthine-ammonia ligase